MTKFSKSFKALRESREITQEKLADDLKISRSAIGMYERGQREPDFATTERIADYFKVNIDTLLGKQPLKETLERWDKKYNPNGKLSKKVQAFEKLLTKIPLYNTPVSAGTGEWLSEGDDYEFVEFEDAPPNADFALRVRGDSMEPMYSDNDIVFVKTGVFVELGDIGVFYLNNDGYLKMLQSNKLVSLNKKYKPITIHEWDSFHCVGRVIGKARLDE